MQEMHQWCSIHAISLLVEIDVADRTTEIPIIVILTFDIHGYNVGLCAGYGAY